MDRRSLLKSAGATLALSVTGAVALAATPSPVDCYWAAYVVQESTAITQFRREAVGALKRRGEIVGPLRMETEYDIRRQQHLMIAVAPVIPHEMTT